MCKLLFVDCGAVPRVAGALKAKIEMMEMDLVQTLTPIMSVKNAVHFLSFLKELHRG